MLCLSCLTLASSELGEFSGISSALLGAEEILRTSTLLSFSVVVPLPADGVSPPPFYFQRALPVL